MVEIDWIARIGKRSIPDTIRELQAAGMDSCPGGGAEIFERRVRDVICKNKISGEEWLAIARECHRQGVRTNATMLYGSVETAEDRVDHLLRLRALQDETGGFSGLIPLAFHPENTPLAHLPETSGRARPAGDRRLAAAARQHRARQGVLDPDRHEARPGGAASSARTTSSGPSWTRRSRTPPAPRRRPA